RRGHLFEPLSQRLIEHRFETLLLYFLKTRKPRRYVVIQSYCGSHGIKSFNSLCLDVTQTDRNAQTHPHSARSLRQADAPQVSKARVCPEPALSTDYCLRFFSTPSIFENKTDYAILNPRSPQ